MSPPASFPYRIISNRGPTWPVRSPQPRRRVNGLRILRAGNGRTEAALTLGPGHTNIILSIAAAAPLLARWGKRGALHALFLDLRVRGRRGWRGWNLGDGGCVVGTFGEGADAVGERNVWVADDGILRNVAAAAAWISAGEGDGQGRTGKQEKMREVHGDDGFGGDLFLREVMSRIKSLTLDEGQRKDREQLDVSIQVACFFSDQVFVNDKKVME